MAFGRHARRRAIARTWIAGVTDSTDADSGAVETASSEADCTRDSVVSTFASRNRASQGCSAIR